MNTDPSGHLSLQINRDQLQHVLASLGLTLAIAGALLAMFAALASTGLSRSSPGAQAIFSVASSTILTGIIGIIIELRGAFDAHDLVADTIGILLGLATLKILSKWTPVASLHFITASIAVGLTVGGLGYALARIHPGRNMMTIEVCDE